MPPSDILAARLTRARHVAVTDHHDALLVTSAVHLRYLFGVVASAGLAVLHAGGVELVVDARYADAFDEVVRTLPGARVHRLSRAGTYEEAAAGVVAALGVAALGVEAESLTVSRLRTLGDRLPGVRLAETQGRLAGLRAVKDAWELAVLRDAGRRLSAVAACILPQVSAGRSERQIAWQVQVALHDAGFDGPAFEPIVASGPNAARPHHRAGDRPIAAGDLVVVDFGGRLDGYAVDMTRTVAVEPVAEEPRRWLAAVGRAARAAAASVAPGVLPSAVDHAARVVLEAEGLGDAFVHSTGHGLGLEVHERPWIAPRGDADGPLETGMVFTIEPGAYLAGRGGVRLEDDVVVTTTGHERLTDAPAPFDHHER
jgi:Xaa-Pro aminopeptidase